MPDCGDRYYNSLWDQFTRPDPGGAGASATAPQSWDMYAYAGDSPATVTDPSGREWCVSSGGGKALHCITDAAHAKLAKTDLSAADQYSRSGPERGATVTASMPPPVPLAGMAQPAGDVFNQLANAITADNPGGFIRHFEISAIATGVLGPVLGAIADGGEAAGAVEAAGEVISDPALVAEKASSTVGGDSITVSDRDVAEQAVDEFLGPDKQPAFDRNTGAQNGWRNSSGTRYVIGPHSDAAGDHLIDRETGSNLHVRW